MIMKIVYLIKDENKELHQKSKNFFQNAAYNNLILYN